MEKTDNEQAQESTELVPVSRQRLNKNAKGLAKRGEFIGGEVPHLSMNQVADIADAMLEHRDGERNRLLVLILFDGCLRISEALGVRPLDVKRNDTGWAVQILGRKQSGWNMVAISSSLAAQLQAYAYREDMHPESQFFPFNRYRAWQIIDRAMDEMGIAKPEGVGTVHILRHSGAIERMRQTNPKAVQDQLRHKSMGMTLRYLKTLAKEESLKIQQGVDFQW